MPRSVYTRYTRKYRTEGGTPPTAHAPGCRCPDCELENAQGTPAEIPSETEEAAA